MCSEGNQAVALKHPINLKTMANLSPDCHNSELLDQELTIEDLSDVSGGLLPFEVPENPGGEVPRWRGGGVICRWPWDVYRR